MVARAGGKHALRLWVVGPRPLLKGVGLSAKIPNFLGWHMVAVSGMVGRMSSVLQPWLEDIPIRMQSTLVLSLRGPDGQRSPEIKKVQRWMRGLAFRPGNPDNVHEFMTAIENVPWLKEKNSLARELEFCPQHFYSHLMHGLEVIGYSHPDNRVRRKACQIFFGMCTLMHLTPEEPNAFWERLGHRTWPGGREPIDYDEARRFLEAAEG